MSYETKYKSDVKLGLELEQQLYPKFKIYFNDETLRQTSRYSKFDFKSTKFLIELKRIKANCTRYRNFMVSHTKILYALKYINKKDIYFVFQYDDNLKYFKFTDQVPKYKQIFTRYDRGKTETPTLYYYYDRELLTDMILT